LAAWLVGQLTLGFHTLSIFLWKVLQLPAHSPSKTASEIDWDADGQHDHKSGGEPGGKIVLKHSEEHPAEKGHHASTHRQAEQPAETHGSNENHLHQGVSRQLDPKLPNLAGARPAC